MSATNSYVQPKLDRAVLASRRQEDWLVGHSTLTTFIYRLTDAFSIVFAATFSAFVVAGTYTMSSQQRTAVLVAVLMAWIIFNAGGLYSSWRGRDYMDQVRAITVCWLTVIVLLVISAYLVGQEIYSDRIWLIWWAAAGLFTLTIVRISAMFGLRAYRKHGHNHKRIVVVGGGQWGEEVVRRVQASEWLGLDVVAVMDHHIELHGQRISGVPLRGGYDKLLDVISEEAVEEVWVCLPLGSRRAGGEDWLGKVMRILNNSTVTQRLLPEIEEMRLLNRPVTEIMGLPVVTLNTSPMHGFARLIKAVEDRLLAALFLILISPLMAMVAVAIKIDSRGPVFFHQRRHGSDGKPFTMFKFRTMNGHSEEEGRVTQARQNDPRVTRVGAFLRRNSLDELPQFINVLKGDMSIVGPRPHAVEHNEFYRTQIDSYMQRHRVKPGITGWAQINGFRGATDNIEKMRRRINHDLYYIDHWSFWFDMKIIFQTIVHGFRGENAF